VPFRLALLVVSFALVSLIALGLLVFVSMSSTMFLVILGFDLSRVVDVSRIVIRGVDLSRIVDVSFFSSIIWMVFNDCSLGDRRRSVEEEEGEDVLLVLEERHSVAIRFLLWFEVLGIRIEMFLDGLEAFSFINRLADVVVDECEDDASLSLFVAVCRRFLDLMVIGDKCRYLIFYGADCYVLMVDYY